LLKRNEVKRKIRVPTTSRHLVTSLLPLFVLLHRRKNVFFRKKYKSKVGGQLIFERNGK